MKLLSLEKKYQGKFLTYYVARYENLNKEIKEYELISRNDNLTLETFHHSLPVGVGMVALSEDKEMILIQKEFRMATNEWVYNFPAGLIDEGEEPLEAAKRELKEETGLDLVTHIATLPPSYSSQGTSDEMMNIVICTVKGEIVPSSFANEEIYPLWLDKKEAIKLLEEKALMSVRTQMFIYLWCNYNKL